MARSHLTEAIKLEIVALNSKKMKVAKISKKVKKSYNTVKDFITRYSERKSIQNRRPPGRPRKLSSRDQRKVIRHAKTNRKQSEGINFIENWPPNSPDLNPIENIWAILKKRVGARKPTEVEVAKTYLREEWARLEADGFIDKFISSIVKRIKAVIKSKGHPTKY